MTIEETTYAEILAKKAKECPDRVAFCSEGQCYTYAELDKITDVFAAKIIGFGIKKNDHVALWGYNCANWFVTYLSIIKAGAVAVLLNYSLPVKDLARVPPSTKSKQLPIGNPKAKREICTSFSSCSFIYKAVASPSRVESRAIIISLIEWFFILCLIFSIGKQSAFFPSIGESNAPST